MIDGEVRNIEVKVLSVGLPLLDICTHWRLFVQEGSLLPDSVSLSESLSFSFLLQHQLCLSPKVASSGESNIVFLPLLPSFLRGGLSEGRLPLLFLDRSLGNRISRRRSRLRTCWISPCLRVASTTFKTQQVFQSRTVSSVSSGNRNLALP